MAETKITKNLAIPCIDVGGVEEPVWKRIDKSTVFEIVMNAETESQDYISQELPTEEIKNYAPSMDQEIATYKGNAIYEFMIDLFYHRKIHHGKVLLCFPENEKGEKLAWMVTDVVFVLGSMNWAEGKLTWSMNFGGDVIEGTYTNNKGDIAFTETPATASDEGFDNA